MSFFPDCNGPVDFTGNTIVIAQGDARLAKSEAVVLEDHSANLAEYLGLLPLARDAMHNSARLRHGPLRGCDKGTREAAQGDINSWITQRDDGPKTTTNVLWLTGPAGAGKTAVAASIADHCDEKGILAGSFFFSSRGSEATWSTQYLISTLAYQIFQHTGLLGAVKRALSSIRGDPNIFDRRLKKQFEVLIMQPLRDFIKTDKTIVSSLLPKVIIIDGLDEIRGTISGNRKATQEQDDVLAILLQAAYDPFFPFRILIASRPEPNIHNIFSKRAMNITNKVVLDETYKPGADIKIFLKSRFISILLSRYSENQVVDQDWPGEAVIDQLVDNSSGQFAYPAAIIRFVDNDSPTPRARLELVRKWRPSSTREKDDPLKPFEHLDSLYEGIILSTPEPQLTVKWLRAIHKSPGLPALFWRQFLTTSEHDMDSALQGLNSLMYIPPFNDRVLPYGFYHQSLVDFLEDGSRSRVLPSDSAENFTQFLHKRFMATLKNKGPPAVELASERDKQEFTSHFLAAVECLHPSSEDAGLFRQRDLTSCDMNWWTTQIIAHPSCTSSGISRSFQFIHSPCSWYRCTKACKLWRKGILDACRAHGWGTPSTMVLLRNRVTRAILTADGVLAAYPTAAYFRPPPASPPENEAAVDTSSSMYHAQLNQRICA